jgi:hypothetical protein
MIGEGPNFDYKYGIWARIGRRGWNARQIKLYFDKHKYPYEESWNKERLITELKKYEK